MERLFGAEGVGSRDAAEEGAAFGALECLMQENSEAAGAALTGQIQQLLDRTKAEVLSPAELQIFRTPEGMSFERGCVL